MKLKNKLLPFVGIAALGASFAPIALTSCGSKTTKTGAIDLREWYAPTIEKHAFTTLSEEQVSKLYFCGDENAEWGDWVDEDEMAERLTQDYLFGSSMWVRNIAENGYSEKTDSLVKRTGTRTNAQNKQFFLSLTGIPGVVGMSTDTKPHKETVTARSKVTFNKYNIVISDVRIGHMTNYYPQILDPEADPVEYPTISFNLDFEIEYDGEFSSVSGGAGKELMELLTLKMEKAEDEKTEDVEVKDSTTSQTHTGTISVVNVPIKIDYEKCSEIDTKSWTLKFDYETLEQTELSTKVPFSITGTDNSIIDTDADIDGTTQHFSSVISHDFDYYSNMLWEQFVSDKTTMPDSTQTVKECAKEAYEYAIGQGATAAQAKKVKDAILIKYGYAIKRLVTYLNDSFFDTLSYYLISVAKK